MEKRHGYRGYVTNRSFGGLLMPVPVQALVMRDYCQRNGLTYKLHINENIFPNSYIILEGLPEELNIYEGILATSMFMMPKRPERRRRIYERILEKGGSLHFVLEDVVIRSADDVEPVEEILMISELLGDIPAPDNVVHPRGVTD